MMRHEITNTSLTVSGGALIAVDRNKDSDVLWQVVVSQGADETLGFLSRVGDRAPLAVANNAVKCFCKLGELVHEVQRAVWFATESLNARHTRNTQQTEKSCVSLRRRWRGAGVSLGNRYRV